MNRELCRVTNGVVESIDEGILQWFGHMERIGKDGIDKRMYAGECVGNSSEGRPCKRWFDTMEDCFKKKKGLDVQASKENGV